MLQRVVSALVCLVLCSSVFANDSVPHSSAVAALPEYRIGVDDVLDVAVWNVAELQKTAPVRPDGKISLPLVNDVVAAGLTPMELRDQLTKLMAVFVHDPDVSVVVREIRSLKVSVLGQVKTPGRYDLKTPATVLDALALAGGLTEFAARRKITVLRSAQRLHCNYDVAVSNGGSASNLALQPGDIVVVP